MVDWDRAQFDAAYQRYNRDTNSYEASYRRHVRGPDGPGMAEVFREQLDQLGLKFAGLGFTPSARILVVGCGFGWLLEYAIDEYGHTRIWGTDVSAWVHANLDASGDLGEAQARPDIAPLIGAVDVTAPDAVQQFRSLGFGLQGRFDWIITDLVAESIAEADLPAFLDACDALLRPNGHVAHLVAVEMTPPGPGDVHTTGRALGMRFRALTDWAAERPSHWWLAVNGGWQLAGGE